MTDSQKHGVGECSDCPPVGYPTDETRCLPCPRRAALLASTPDLQREIKRLREALKLWLAYDNCDEADFTQSGPMLLYAEAINATRSALNPASDG